jgi:uncharacterized membrane protein
MTDQTKPGPSDDAAVADSSSAENLGGIQAAGIVAAKTDRALVVAQFPDPNSALETYQALVDAEVSGHLTVEGVLVVQADASGNIVVQKVTDHSTKTGLKWGIVGGIVLGVLFPPSIIGSATALGVTGGVLGKLRHEHHKSELGASLSGSLAPNTSGILVLAALPTVPDVKMTMPKATKVTEVRVDSETADAIKAASKAP